MFSFVIKVYTRCIFISIIFEDEITVYKQHNWDFNSLEYLNGDVIQSCSSIEFHSNSTGMNLMTMGYQIILVIRFRLTLCEIVY